MVISVSHRSEIPQGEDEQTQSLSFLIPHHNISREQCNLCQTVGNKHDNPPAFQEMLQNLM